MQVSQASTSDVQQIQTLLHDTWQATYSSFLSQKTLDEVYKNWQNIEFLTRQIENPKMFFPIVKEGDKIVGVATARLMNQTVQLFRLYVSPDTQRRGIGALLLSEVVAHYPKANKVQIHVEVLNENAQAFYKKQGFKEISREKEQVGEETLDEILMEKEI